MSNHEMAKRYREKSKLIGKDILDIKLLENDRVELVEVLDKEDTGRLVIPSFITDINKYGSVLRNCRYEEIYVDNIKEIKVDRLCTDMVCSELKVRFKNPRLVSSLSGMFSGCKNLIELDVHGICTNSVEDISDIFDHCWMLKRIHGLESWDVSGVKDMSNIFDSCYWLKRVYVGSWDTSSVEDMSGIFSECSQLEYIDISKWDVSRVKDMSDMFNGCKALDGIDVGKWDTSSVEDIHSIFRGCVNLSSIDVREWDVSSVKDMDCMCANCNSLKVIDVSKWDTRSVQSINGLFYCCNKLEYIDLSNWDINKVNNMISVFNGCTNLRDINFGNLDMSNIRDISGIFSGCRTIESIDLSKVNIRVIGDNVFNRCNSLREVKLSHIGGLGSILDTNGMFNGWEREDIEEGGLSVYIYRRGKM